MLHAGALAPPVAGGRNAVHSSSTPPTAATLPQRHLLLPLSHRGMRCSSQRRCRCRRPRGRRARRSERRRQAPPTRRRPRPAAGAGSHHPAPAGAAAHGTGPPCRPQARAWRRLRGPGRDRRRQGAPRLREGCSRGGDRGRSRHNLRRGCRSSAPCRGQGPKEEDRARGRVFGIRGGASAGPRQLPPPRTARPIDARSREGSGGAVQGTGAAPAGAAAQASPCSAAAGPNAPARLPAPLAGAPALLSCRCSRCSTAALGWAG